jgi:hypothetical protein
LDPDAEVAQLLLIKSHTVGDELCLGWERVSYKARQLVGVEEDRKAALNRVAAARQHAVGVVPAVGMKRIDYSWRAKDKAHLLARHARMQLRRHFLRNHGPLLDVDAIHQMLRKRHPGTAAKKNQGGAGHAF